MSFLFKSKRQPQVLTIGPPLPPPPKSFRFYAGPRSADSEKGPGLAVEVVPASDYHERTLTTLNAIYACPTGKTVIDTLVGSGFTTKITRATLGNSCDVGPKGLVQHAEELCNSRIGPATKSAFQNVQAFGEEGYAWLAGKINGLPFWELKGEPRTQSFNCGVTAQELKDWFRLGQIACKGAKLQHVLNGLIYLLADGSQDGPGSSAAIGFNADPNFVLNKERPVGVGLAHELIHAYWSAQGKQLGWPVSHPTTVLFEYRCVGLGPWRWDAISENQMRAEWFQYTSTAFEPSDHVNRSAPVSREYYSKPE